MLDQRCRQSRSKGILKSRLKHIPKPNKYYSYEDTRMGAVSLTRLRCGNNNLNKHLLVESPCCSCGAPTEDVTHFLINCPNHDAPRRSITTTIPVDVWQTNTLLHGSPRYTDDLNKLICITVQRFIMCTIEAFQCYNYQQDN